MNKIAEERLDRTKGQSQDGTVLFCGIGNSDRIPYSIKASRACKDAHSAQW